MNREEIIRMAREAASEDGTTRQDKNIVLYAAKTSKFLERFAYLVADVERQECAKICADIAMHRDVGSFGMLVAHSCANEILERGDHAT